jgi:hypothetical protein
MSRKFDTMDMLRRTMEGSALAGGVMGGMYGSALQGGAVNTKGVVKKKTERKSIARSAQEYAQYPVNVPVFKAGKIPKGAKRGYTVERLSYDDYLSRLQARQVTNQANEAALAQAVKREIAEKKLKNPNVKRLSGEELLLLKYRIRNQTKRIKKRLPKDERKNLSVMQLADPVFREQYGFLKGRQSGHMSDAELKEREDARASLAGQQLTRAQYMMQLRQKYDEISKRYKRIPGKRTVTRIGPISSSSSSSSQPFGSSPPS